MNRFDWQDYTHEHTALEASWLNADAVRMTGMDEGFDAFHQYWKNESSPERGEYFWSKLVSENGHPFAVISYGYCNGTVTIMEIVVDPAVCGQGKGTAVISEFLNNAAAWIAQPITVFNAVVFQRNTASQIAFYKAGFVLEDKDQERWKRTVNDSEILFRYMEGTLPSFPSDQIRWLGPDERRLFNSHQRLCDQNCMPISVSSFTKRQKTRTGCFTE